MAYDKIAGTASGEMMLRYMADRIIKSVDGAIGHNMVSYDFERLMDGNHPAEMER